MKKTTIVEGKKLNEFFRDKVKQALVHQKVETTEVVEFYLVNLLGEFRVSEKLFQLQGENLVEKPLALFLLEAMAGDTSHKTRCLKKLGDTALYTAGFFEQYLNRKIVQQEYYISMGESAYKSLAAIFEMEKTFGTLYRELGEKFSQLVTVLTEISPWNDGNTNINLLRLYERWLKTGDEHLEQLLNLKGIQTRTSQGTLQ